MGVGKYPNQPYVGQGQDAWAQSVMQDWPHCAKCGKTMTPIEEDSPDRLCGGCASAEIQASRKRQS